MTTVGCTGSSSSDTSACRGWDWIGRSNPAIAATTEECPAAASAIEPAAIRPRVVCTATARPSTTSTPVTSQFWIRSTPIASARRAKPQAT